MRYLKSKYRAACPICSHAENRLLYKVSSKEAAMHFVVTQNVGINKLPDIAHKIATLWNNDTAAVVLCKNCRFGFAHLFVAGDAEFYNMLPHASGEEDTHWKWEYGKTYNEIATLASEGADLSLIEIGAGTGAFVKRVVGLIPKENIFCIEYSNNGVDYIRRAGIEAHAFDFHLLASKKEFSKKFDIICLFQVLEHLDKLDETFETFNAIIKPGGHLFIGVPNDKKIKFNELNGALLDMPPNHVGRYSEKAFKLLAEKHTWDIDETAIEPYSSLDVMKTVLYYRSLKNAQLPPVKRTTWYSIREYLDIKFIRLQAIFRHKHLGETRWIHFRKPFK